MAYEYPCALGVLTLARNKRRWAAELNGVRTGSWPSPEAAAKALARYRSGLSEWDTERHEVSADLLDWRPLGESL